MSQKVTSNTNKQNRIFTRILLIALPAKFSSESKTDRTIVSIYSYSVLCQMYRTYFRQGQWL